MNKHDKEKVTKIKREVYRLAKLNTKRVRKKTYVDMAKTVQGVVRGIVDDAN